MAQEGSTQPKVAINAPGMPGHLDAHEGGGIDGDGAGGHLGNGDDVGKLGHA